MAAATKGSYMRGPTLALLAAAARRLRRGHGRGRGRRGGAERGAAARSLDRRRSPARDACTARAAQLGAVHVIDIERRGPGKAIVWGTVGEGAARRSFECRYDGRIVGFKLRAIER
jgi:hypothetical protein